jgi:hypothetical protein
MPSQTTISTKTLSKAAEGPHAHWGFRHMDSEGVRFHMLHKLVAEKRPDEGAMRSLLKQIRAFVGYEAFAICDVNIRRSPHVECELEVLKGVFLAARDQGYLEKMTRSLSLLRKEASPAAARILDEKATVDRFLSAFRKGAEERQDFDRRAAPSAVAQVSEGRSPAMAYSA